MMVRWQSERILGQIEEVSLAHYSQSCVEFDILMQILLIIHLDNVIYQDDIDEVLQIVLKRLVIDFIAYLIC